MQLFVILVVAAGIGRRLGVSDVPKQYLQLASQTVLAHSITRLVDKLEYMYQIRVVIHKAHAMFYEEAIMSLEPKVSKCLLPPVYGGTQRQDSVRIGLESLCDIGPQFVIIHDACRPFADLPDMGTVVESLQCNSGVVPAIQPVDTMGTIKGGLLAEKVERDTIRMIQTPQIFRFADALECHRQVSLQHPDKNFTDDASLLLYCGKHVETVKGDFNNFKITIPEDMARARAYMLEHAH
ncbi:2-C-methyl-D-erythritol 4-phosphate cytidylyltransferase [Anaplasma platys]|uniref:2-C-methyl-D-erythritol 4-phosphate cytidylyltransferase n=1 Tax=Anaplasma platys TaxID=949 RepID=A0A858PX77_9RICK|nr:IspD/TarI family cytidylyltransferase [Anaplasma platys]QJC27182.1 2-C-methyl-D-erythritol 4-phosphate cytidylyltransferase [Anaplasma platys]